jgi:hypothetical protein
LAGRLAAVFLDDQGVDVMITIFCDFRQFLCVKIGVLVRNQYYDPHYAEFSSVLNQKRHFVAEFFGENFF